MMNYIWPAIMIISVVVSFFTGKFEAVSVAAIEGAGDGVKLCLELCGVMCFWTGIMEIAEKGGIVKRISKLLSPLTRLLFPKIPQNSRAMSAIVMNMTANILGMANAATPLGLKAMQELKELNKNKDSASDEMCMFVVINTASIQLIPATLIALRAAAGSAAPTEIILPVWITSAASVLVGVTAAKIFQKRKAL
ncbi:MAG: nucleoside recognition protein [Clostridia bacterium]|nr:nucleoside recognition protein [Clostridia bacterium]